MILAVSDSVLITTLILAAVPGLGAVIVSIVTAIRTKENAEISQANQAKIHSLVNSAMTDQKRISLMCAQRLADVTRDPKDIALAVEAKKIYDDAVISSEKQKP